MGERRRFLKKPVKPRIDLTGRKFGRLLVTGVSVTDTYEDGSPKGASMFVCRCDCGKESVVRGNALSSGKSNSCGCRRLENLRAKLCGRPFEFQYNLLVAGAAKRTKSIAVDLSYEEFIGYTKEERCHYCDERVNWVLRACDRPKLGYSYNLDRKNSEIGYSTDNCVVCCRRCNWSKSDQFSYEEWKQIGNTIKSWRKNVGE